MDETQVAESQTATAVEEPQASETPTSPIPDPKDMTDAQLRKWKNDPNWADEYFNKPETQDAATAENTPDKESAAEKAPKKAKTGEDRKQQLTAQIQEKAREKRALDEEIAKRRAELEDLKKPRESSKQEVDTAPPAGAKKQESTNGKPVAPNRADYEDWESFDEARSKHYEDLADWKADQKYNQRESAKAYNQKWMGRINEAREVFPDWAEVVPPMTEALKVAPVIGRYLEKSAYSGKILYRLCEDAGSELDRISKLGEYDQIEQLVEIAKEFKTSKASTPEPVPTRISRAPAPAANLSPTSKGGDPLQAAIANDDVGEYLKLRKAEDEKRLRR